jgi:tellurite methyltransferase
MMTDEDHDDGWEEYYAAITDREPRPLFRRLMSHLERAPVRLTEGQVVIDLGCGDGTEALALLENGWRVLAIDRQPSAIDRLLKRVSSSQKNRLRTEIVPFENADLPGSDLVYAGLSLPFCSPESFPAVWEKIVGSIRPGGFFAGHFFGERDGWSSDPDMTFLTKTETLGLFMQFAIEDFVEVDEPGRTATQGPKHWHIFEVIARRTDD